MNGFCMVKIAENWLQAAEMLGANNENTFEWLTREYVFI